jgi:hypothetical protein
LSLTIQPVLPANIHQSWGLVEGFLADALKWGGDDYTIDQVKVFLTRGDWLLVVAVDENNSVKGAGAISFNNMPNHRVAFVIAMGGRLIINKTSLEQLKVIVQQMGATKIQAAVRPSMEKLLRQTNFYKRYMIVETKI